MESVNVRDVVMGFAVERGAVFCWSDSVDAKWLKVEKEDAYVAFYDDYVVFSGVSRLFFERELPLKVEYCDPALFGVIEAFLGSAVCGE